MRSGLWVAAAVCRAVGQPAFTRCLVCVLALHTLCCFGRWHLADDGDFYQELRAMLGMPGDQLLGQQDGEAAAGVERKQVRGG